MSNQYVGKRASEPVAPRRSRKPLIIVLALLLLAGIAGGGYYALRGHTKFQPLTVAQEPPLGGTTLTIPFKDDFGNPPCKPIYDGKTTSVTDGVPNANVSKNDNNIYDPRTCERVAFLQVPVNGECPHLADGSLGAPADYTTVCYYKDPRGGVAYLGHSILGPRVGALEYTYNLKPGDVVKVGDKTYTVRLVSIFDKQHLPDRLWQKGHFSLISCYDSAQAIKDGRTTENIVTELSDPIS